MAHITTDREEAERIAERALALLLAVKDKMSKTDAVEAFCCALQEAMRLRVARKVLFGGRQLFLFDGNCLLVSHRAFHGRGTLREARRRWLKWRRRLSR